MATRDMTQDACPRCGQVYPFGDPRTMVPGRQCYECDYNDHIERNRSVTPEQRHAGFVSAMRNVDTATLRRWATNEMITSNRREVAAQVLRERKQAAANVGQRFGGV